MHIDISNKYNSKNKVILLEISSYRTDIYRNKNGLYKFVTIRYADFFKDSQGYYIDKELYKSKLQDKKIDKNYEFMFSLHRNEILSLKEKDKEKRYYRFTATNNDEKNVCEVKSLDRKDEKRQVFITIGQKTLLIEKFAVSPAGRISKIERNIAISKIKW